MILATLHRMGRLCLACSRALPKRAAAKLRYCNTRCRSRAYRERHPRSAKAAPASDAAPRAPSPRAPSGAATPSPLPRPAPTAKPPRSSPKGRQPRPSRARARKPPVADLLNQLRTELLGAIAATEHRILARAQQGGLLVPLARQLLSQAPPNAAGYRLVLPPEVVGGKPRYAPRKTAAGTAPCWTVRPLQLPDDDRLRDGETYRIIWLDAQGRRIPPSSEAGVPGLRFCLSRATSSDDPIDKQYEQALLAASGQPDESAVRKRVTERTLRRAQELEEQAALARQAERQAAELQRREVHLAAARKQTEALAEVQRRAKELADAQIAAQHPAWQRWLPVALSLVPVLIQIGLLYWEQFQKPADPNEGQPEAAPNKLHEAFHEALTRISGALDKLADPPAQPAGHRPQVESSNPAPSLSAPGPRPPEPEAAAPMLASNPGPPAQSIASAPPKMTPALFDLEQKKRRMAEIQKEVESLMQAPDSPEKASRLMNLHSEATQLVEQARALSRQDPTPAQSSPLPSAPAAPAPPPKMLLSKEQMEAKLARFYTLNEQHSTLSVQPPSAERDRQMADGLAEAQALISELAAARDAALNLMSAN